MNHETKQHTRTYQKCQKRKGLTQQNLAQEAGVSLRTIQRIEKGTEEISGYSLKRVSQVLEIPLEELVMSNVNQISVDENQIGSIKALYLSSLCFIVNPLLDLIVPAILGFSKQNKNAQYKKHLRKILKFHAISLVIGSILLFLYLYQFTLKANQLSVPSFLNIGFFEWITIAFPILYYTTTLLWSLINFLFLSNLKN